MNNNRLIDYLDHIRDAAQQVCSYIEGMDWETFLADPRTQQAVIMNVVIIGEAATRLLNDHVVFLDSHSEIPWRNMKGMRNRIAHGYFDIDLGVVWETAQSALPDLLAKLPPVREDACIWSADNHED